MPNSLVDTLEAAMLADEQAINRRLKAADAYRNAYNLLVWDLLKIASSNMTKNELKEEMLKAMTRAQGELT